MSSDSEYSESNISFDRDSSSESDTDYDTYNSIYEPYEDEPLAEDQAESNTNEAEGISEEFAGNTKHCFPL